MALNLHSPKAYRKLKITIYVQIISSVW